MKIAVIQFNTNSLHVAVTLEILKKYARSTKESNYFFWGISTRYLSRSTQASQSFSKKLPTRYRKIVLSANPNVNYSTKMIFDDPWVQKIQSQFYSQIVNMGSINDLNDLNYKGIKPGSALINEITFLTRSSNPNMKKNLRLIMFLLNSYLQVYSATSLVISSCKIERVYLYNGRFLHERAVWDSAKQLGVDCKLYETMRDRYLLSNIGFHNRVNNQKIMLKHWYRSNLKLQKKIEIGSKYFQDLESSLNKFYASERTELKMKQEYFVFYSSSDDEYAGLGSNWNKKLGGQIACIEKLQEIFSAQDRYKLIIRIHPNLKNKSTGEVSLWRSIKSVKNSSVITEESNISSYRLLQNACGVITFGSTIGLEAAFKRKPCLVLADCGYDLLGVCDKANNWIEVVNWLQKGHIKSDKELTGRRTNACIRGYYLATGGTKFIYSSIKQTGGSGAWDATSFAGIDIYKITPSYFYHRIVYKIKLIFLSIRFNI